MAIALPSRQSTVDEATKLVDTYFVNEPVSALRAFKLDDEVSGSLGQSQTSYEDAQLVGITLTAATTGSLARVLSFGILEDSFFNFPLNAPLFLKSNGIISDVPELTGFSTQIGHSLGNGAIFINIREPITL